MKNALRCVPIIVGVLLLTLAAVSRGADLPMPQLVSPVRLPPQGGLSLYALSPTRMVRPSEDPGLWKHLQAADHVELAAARNESEQFFLVLHPNQSLKQLQLRFVPDGDSAIAASDWTWWQALSVNVSKESYWYGVRGTLTGEIFDPLIKGGAFDAPANVNTLLLLQVHIPRQAKAGLYKGIIQISSGEKILARIPYQVTAWDITLPDTRALQTMVTGTRAFGEDRPSWQLLRDNHVQWLKYGATGLSVSYDKKTGQLAIDTRKYEKELQVALDEVGISHVALPPKLLGHSSKLSQNYLGTGIAVGSEQFWPIYDQFMKQMGDFYRQHGWASRICFYMMDEINPKYYPLATRLATEARKQYPELQLLLVTDRMPDDLAKAINIWVVPWHFFITRPKDVAHWDELRARGMSLWAYMNSLYTLNATWTLSAMRFYPSVLAKYGYKGNLWWSVSSYNGQDPWKAGIATLSNEKEKKRHYANGYLFYPPRHKGDSWSPSLRWESYEQGLDEYELLHMLHQRWAEVSNQLGERGKEPAFSADEAVRWWGSMLASGFRLQSYRRDGGYIQRFRQLVVREIEAIPQPPLVLLECILAKATPTSSLHLRGICQMGTRLTINGKNVQLQGLEGNIRFFEYNQPLHAGQNLVILQATDPEGHQKTLYREVTWQSGT